MKTHTPSPKQSMKQSKRGKQSFRGSKGSKHSSTAVSKRNYQNRFADDEFEKGEKAGSRLATKKFNDISWYNKNPNLLRDAGSFPYGVAAGIPLPAKKMFIIENYPIGVQNKFPGFMASAMSTPGIMTIGIAPTVGIARDRVSPINVASLANYDFVRKMNSGAKNYDWPDLTMMYNAMDSIFMYWNWLQRLYGLLMQYDPENRYTPQALIEAQGVSFDDLTANIANFRSFINLSAAKCRAFCVPSTFTYMIRHSWLMSHVYMDQETSKAQYYMFVPSWVYKYSERTSDKGGELIPVKVCQNLLYSEEGTPSKLLTYADLRDIMNELLEAVLSSEDIGTMSGDVAKAYGSNLFTLSAMSEDYKVVPTYSKEVLSQIENLTVIPVDGVDYSIDNLKIKQDPDTNIIIWDPKFTAPDVFGKSQVIINLHSQVPTVDETVIATRLTATLEKSADNTFRFNAIGTEWVTGLYVHQMTVLGQSDSWDGQPTPTPWYTRILDFQEDTQPDMLTWRLRSAYVNPELTIDLPKLQSEWGPTKQTDVRAVLTMQAMLSNFDWKPLTRVIVKGQSHAHMMPLNGDLDKFTIVNSDNLEMLHLACLMSMYDVAAN